MIDEFIQSLATTRLTERAHGPMTSMGVKWHKLPVWDDLDLVMADDRLPESADVGSNLVIGENRGRPLELEIPLLISDMSFGSLSMQAKVTLARGAELAGTAICSGEGGILAEEIRESSRYMYELGTGEFGYRALGDRQPLWPGAQSFHFKGGQAAKTGTGGHLPAEKATDRIADTRGVEPGKAVISPPTFRDLRTVADFRRRVDEVQEAMGDVPIGFKLSANRLEEDIEFALQVGADYIILDGRGGSTGAAPILFRDHISIPTIPALIRARQILDAKVPGGGVKLIITGGLRVPTDFVKAMALGADGVALANSALQAVGCIGTRRCQSNLCPAGIATQDPVYAMNFQGTPEQLSNYLGNSVAVMQRLARACGHSHLDEFTRDDLQVRNPEMAHLTGLPLGTR